MSWIKWLFCWYHQKHIFTRFYDKDGKCYQKCVRCGYTPYTEI